MSHSIPLIDIGPLFGAASLDRDLTDQAIMAAAATSGFMVVRRLPPDVPAGRAARADLLRLFQLPEHETRKLLRQKFAPAHPNGDPLREATPLPSAEALPGWRESVSAYYRAMEKVSQALMRAIARGLSLEECFFDRAFDRGLSTLRLLRYPVRTDTELTARSDPNVWVTHGGAKVYVNGAPHVDSGFLTP